MYIYLSNLSLARITHSNDKLHIDNQTRTEHTIWRIKCVYIYFRCRFEREACLVGNILLCKHMTISCTYTYTHTHEQRTG